MSAPARWVDGELVDGEMPRPRAAWSRIFGVLALLLLVDLSLGLVPAERAPAALASSADLRGVLRAAADAADEGRTLLVLGDSVLAGDVLAASRPDDWAEHRVLDAMTRELGTRAAPGVAEPPASLHQIALDGVLPIDLLHLVAELDRLDPDADVELVIEVNLRYFSSEYAKLEGCTRAEICALAPGSLQRSKWAPMFAWASVERLATSSRDWLRGRAPIRRHHARIGGLDELGGLARARDGDGVGREAPDTVEGEARIAEHYRDARIEGANVQLRAFARMLERIAASGRRATLFMTPLRDDFAAASIGEDTLAARASALARIVQDYGGPHAQLLDLDHPLFVAEHFIDHVHLQPEGARLLAINLLHELGLPLRHRPFEVEMVHPEGHDRSLVHQTLRGYREGGAWTARFNRPQGVAVDRQGTQIVVADTGNHVLRLLRGNMQHVETIAGRPRRPGDLDGPARSEARLDRPRHPELLGDAVWFIDGAAGERVRVLEHDWVRTPAWDGPECEAYARLRTERSGGEGGEAGAGALWMLCQDGRLLRLAIDAAGAIASARELAVPGEDPLRALELGPDAVYVADARGRLWRRDRASATAQIEPAWELIFASAGPSSFPHGHGVQYPYHHDELRLESVLDLRYVERYGGLLVADEFPANTEHEGLRNRFTERVHLRYFDLDAERVLPWIVPLVHGDGQVMYNERVDQLASYWHLGSLAVVADDASLVWVETQRSRILRVADGLLGVAKSGNHHTSKVSVPILMPIAKVSRAVEAQLRPDRYLDRRHEPIPRRGPYVAALFGSSLSSMSDRVSNYSLGRRLELELQRELGYRDNLRLDLFQVSWAAATLSDNVNNFANWLETSVPPDVVFIEVHDFGSYLRDTDVPAQLARLRRLASIHDTLVVLYDMSSIEANRRDGMRETDRDVREMLVAAEGAGFVVLDVGDRLLPKLLMHAPWGNQPFGQNQHHGSIWAVDLTAQALAASVAPPLREHLRAREPARRRTREAAPLQAMRRGKSLRRALDGVDLDDLARAPLRSGYVQTNFIEGRLYVYVDLAGFDAGEDPDLEALALTAMGYVLRDEIHAELAHELELSLMRFASYDEYGQGVLDSAEVAWSGRFYGRSLRRFVDERVP